MADEKTVPPRVEEGLDHDQQSLVAPPPYSQDVDQTWIRPPESIDSALVPTVSENGETDTLPPAFSESEERTVTDAKGGQEESGIPTVPPKRTISHQIILHHDTSPEELRLPPSFERRNVHEQDWFTFRNHLFPARVFTSRDRKGEDEKHPTDEKGPFAEKSLDNKAGDSGPRLPEPDVTDFEEDVARRQKVHKTVREWNADFFKPRGLLIIAKVPPKESGASDGKNLNSNSVFSKTILSKAAARGDYKVVEDLLLRGADPDAQPFNGSPALHHALTNKHSSIVELLLQHGAKPDTKPSVLQLAAGEGDVPNLTTLLEYGANPDHKGWMASSPLLSAVIRSDIDVVRLLLAYGADPDYANTGGHSALYYAIKKDDAVTIQLLLDHKADPNQRPWSGQSCLHLAVSLKNMGAVKALLATKRVDTDVAPPMSHTPLALAISRADKQLTKLLLEHGAKASVKTMGSQTPAFFASSEGNVEILRVLLEVATHQEGVDINDSPPGYPSPLYMAVHRQDFAVAELLLHFGANSNSGNPLAVAVAGHDAAAVELLLSHGADPNSKPTGGQLPFATAATNGDSAILEMLVNKGANVNSSGYPSPLVAAVQRGDVAIAKVLVDAGADTEEMLPNGQETVRSFAASLGSEDMKNVFEDNKVDRLDGENSISS